jgi:glucose-1-phosphate adenylyltransferase
MQDVVTAVLGGGQGSRLFPLTRDRAKPAVPLAGKYRLIDVPISNSLQAHIDRIYVLTQFSSASLHRHIAQTYRFDNFSHGFVNILAAEQSVTSSDWYQGTADAVRQNLGRLQESGAREILILSGDQLYLMELTDLVQSHRTHEADLTVAVKPVAAREAPGLGIMRIDRRGRILEFVEKPKDPAVIADLALDAATIEELELKAEPGMLLASMGIYVFNTPTLASILTASHADDFGKEVIPAALHSHRVFGWVHTGYWRDIGTIGAFHEANLDLAKTLPELDLYSEEFPIYTHPRFLPPCKVNRCEISESTLADGSILSASRVHRSVIGIRAVLEEGSVVEESIVMGSTSYRRNHGPVPTGVGRGCRVRRAIIDLDACVGDGSVLLNESGVEHADGENYYIREGIIVIPRRATLLPGTVI